MRKHLGIISIVLVSLILLSSCAAAPTQSGLQSAPPSETGGTAPSPSATADPGEKDASPSPGASSPPGPSAENTARETVFIDFISDNFEALSDAFFGGISGIGFIDLDMDGGIEMIIFDAGASASMGVQFFDIIEGNVECVSASMQPVREAFGGEHTVDTYVNANYFDDFRLMKDKATGEMFYLVSSGNGAIDFSYRELIRFSGTGGVLSLTALLYKYEDYSEDTGDVTGANYKIGKNPATLSEYTAAYDKIYADAEDTGLEAKGAFVWDSQTYTQDKDGVMAMARAAIELSRGNFPE